MKKRGFTLIELLAVIVILSIILLITTPIILNILKDTRKASYTSSIKNIMRTIEDKYVIDSMNESLTDIVYEYSDNKLISNNKINYKGKHPEVGKIKVTKDGFISLVLYSGEFCAIKEKTGDLIISEVSEEECLKDIINEENDGFKEIVGFNEEKGVNHPELVTGMTPIIWNGIKWVEVNQYDPNWYDYSDKQWANARTEDGSYWVWIPRYAYSITSGYHTSTSGNIEIKFLKNNTNETVDETMVELQPTYSGSSQTNYVKHPAFIFNGEELGFWVAKFEPSGTPSNISIVPNVASIRNLKIGDQFDVAYNLKNNSKYGWNANEVDTHMMKNSEWGAVAYLSKSKYGANAEVWINNSSTYLTGCGGNTVAAAAVAGCQNQYDTTVGMRASTTHNIYGIYDMSGGSFEFMASYINNGHSNLVLNGQSIVAEEDSKYKDDYDVVLPDTEANNYNQIKNIFGNAIWEVSTEAISGSSNSSWYNDYSLMPSLQRPFFIHGLGNSYTTQAGIFSFARAEGNAGNNHTFRPVVFEIK